LTGAFFVTAAFLAGAFFAGTDYAASLAALIAAHSFFCAAAIRFRAAALICRLAGSLVGAVGFFSGWAAAVFAAILVAAHLFRCAAAIRYRPSALSFRVEGFLAGAAVVRPCKPASKPLACWSRAISASIAEIRLSMPMVLFSRSPL
jgi:hypothetical protein